MKRKQRMVGRIKTTRRTKRSKQSIYYYLLRGRCEDCSMITETDLHSEGVMVPPHLAIVMLLSWFKHVVTSLNHIFSISYYSICHESIYQFITVLQ